jgi:RecJ-like exonuclease
MTASFEKMLEEFKKAVDDLKDHYKEKSVRVITHNDADGISSGAIVHKALLREGIGVVTTCVKQLDENILSDLVKDDPEIVVFTDIGSGQLRDISSKLGGNCQVIILDHHQPSDFYVEEIDHLNPHPWGIDGAREVSGSGMTYFFAKVMNPKNIDLSTLAIVGAIGDIQDADGRLVGLNELIVKDGVTAGVLKVEKDLRLFGRQTRPLYKALEYTTEPFIPGLSGSESSCIQFLSDLDIPVKKNEEYTMLADLTRDERKRLVTALILKMIEHKIPPKTAENIVGDVFTFLQEEKRTPLRDAKEYATLLNACGKNEDFSIGIAVCLGDRGNIYHRSLDLLSDHKNHISSCFEWISDNMNKIKDGGPIYYFHAEGEINENILGTVTSMVLNSRVLEPLKPVIGLTYTDEGKVKVSARGNKELIERGLNLGKAMMLSAEKVGGSGGGHDIAAGAQIDTGKEGEFIQTVVEIIKEQYDG